MMKLTYLLGCTICVDIVEDLSNRTICIDTVKGFYDLKTLYVIVRVVYDTVEGSK